MIYFTCVTKFNDSRFSSSRDIIGVPKFKINHLTLSTPILRVICHPHAGTLHNLYLCPKIQPINHSIALTVPEVGLLFVGAHQNLKSLRDLTTLFSEMVCHPRASTCYTINLSGALKMREWKMQEWKKHEYRSHGWNMQEWKIQELKDMESHSYRNF